MKKTIRIGTRESELAVWQANTTKNLLEKNGYTAELVYIKSEGDIDLKTPLYAMGVQGVFTRSLDAALLNQRIDIAVHSMKDVPVQLPKGIVQAAVLERASYKDILVLRSSTDNIHEALNNSSDSFAMTIGTSSIRRKAQWLHRYPHHQIENLRGNVNTRLQKVAESNWSGAIFAAAGLERINLKPSSAIELDWMLPAPAQGAIMIVCRGEDQWIQEACTLFNDETTAVCTKVEREFLSGLLGGCSTPISALASIDKDQLHFKGNIVLPDGSQKASIEKVVPLNDIDNLGNRLALELIINGGELIANKIRTKEK
ncbi:hydroxymethylbilane synthase [Gynurincola endophyticus]|uniref:hydroxymethylbilane synthase n=1 Tax=Gynurincola endophyticus TaxID=2479004 RepID=UPI000F8C93E4|nr:hydroxymethylbilane synthase [Gynurincola endophyticus]